MNTKLFAMIIMSLAVMPVRAQQQSVDMATPSTQVLITAPSHAINVAQKLCDIKRVFVAPLGTGEGADLIRQKVINKLVGCGIVSIVDSADAADATLTGAAELDPLYSGARYSAEGVVRLVGKDKQILWSGDIVSRRFFKSRSARGASSNVADKMVRALLAAIEADRSQIASK